MSQPGSSGSDRPEASGAETSSPTLPVGQSRDIDIAGSIPDAAEILRYATSVSISHKAPEQLAHDLEMERLKELNKQEAERSKEEYRRQVETRNFWIGVAATAFLAVVASTLIFRADSTEETRRQAFGYLFAIFTYWMGFIGGRAGKEPPKSGE